MRGYWFWLTICLHRSKNLSFKSAEVALDCSCDPASIVGDDPKTWPKDCRCCIPSKRCSRSQHVVLHTQFRGPLIICKPLKTTADGRFLTVIERTRVQDINVGKQIPGYSPTCGVSDYCNSEEVGNSNIYLKHYWPNWRGQEQRKSDVLML